jgi:hypothetical protein
MLDEIERNGSMKLIPVKRRPSLRADRQSAAGHPAERVEGGFDQQDRPFRRLPASRDHRPTQTAGINAAAVSSCPVTAVRRVSAGRPEPTHLLDETRRFCDHRNLQAFLA